MALDELLAPDAVRVGVAATDWRAAVRASGDALVGVGATTPAYGEEMVEAVERLGPYIVMAPGVALAHARPGEAVLRTALSLVVLAVPVEFGHHANDPVSVVIGLAAHDHDAHLAALSELATAIGDGDLVTALAQETDPVAARDRVLAAAGSRVSTPTHERTTG